MTITRTSEKSSFRSQACKAVTKKSVCFASSDYKPKIKLSKKVVSIQAISAFAEQSLQATETRRRYMRRGSKAPTMMLISQSEIDRLHHDDEDILRDEAPVVESPEEHLADQQQQMIEIQHQIHRRRPSIMSALKIHFEKVTIIDRKICRRMSFESSSSSQHRRYSIEELLG